MAPETQGHLYLISTVKELLHAAHFYLIIMLINIWPQFDFFNVDDLLFLSSFISSFLRFIFEFAIIQYFTDWRVGVGLNLDQIKTKILGFTNGL